MDSINNSIAEIARSLVGIVEVEGKNKNFTSKNKNREITPEQFKEWLLVVGWSEGQPYCSYSAEIVYKCAYSRWNTGYVKVIDRLFSANAMQTYTNAITSYYELIIDLLTGGIPQLGALCFFAKYKNGVVVKNGQWTSGHIGIVVNNSDLSHFDIFEGNTFSQTNSREGNGNFIKTHSYNEYHKNNGLRLIGFMNPISV